MLERRFQKQINAGDSMSEQVTGCHLDYPD